MRKVIGLLDFHTSPDIAPITDSRPLGSTSFLGRFACCDFAMSCFTYSNIPTVGLLVKDHQRSILKHLGSMDAWQNNTKLSQTVVMYNESFIGKPSLNTDVRNIRENDWVIYDSDATHLVILPAHILASLHLDAIIEEHIQRGDEITVIVTPVEHLEKEYLGQTIVEVNDEGYVKSHTLNKGKKTGRGLCSMSAYIIDRTTLADLCSTELELEPKKSLRELIPIYVRRRGTRVHAHIYDGFSICIDSFQNYIDYSFRMLDPLYASKLFRPDCPIYTLNHDTPPTIYGKDAKVKESFIANGCLVEGEVTHSIISRDVKIAKGAKVKNSIIFSSVKIDAGAVVENALIDKYSIITKRHIVKGDKEFAYIRQGAIL